MRSSPRTNSPRRHPVDSYTKIALDWMTDHPTPDAVTTDPDRWAVETGTVIRQRIHDLVDHLAPPVANEEYMARVGRLNAAEMSAREVAIEEYLPSYTTPDDEEDWVPLMPDISDLL
jgi:hypothetical protein